MIPAEVEDGPFNSYLVLASKKPEVLDKKGKGYADAKWEAELRQKLNAKKTQITLSKQDQALVSEQLQKEADIRKRVSEIKAKLEHGLELVHSLSSANVEEFPAYAPQIASMLQSNAFSEASEVLVGAGVFNTFLVRTVVSTIGSCADMCLLEGERRPIREVGINPYLGCCCCAAFSRSQWDPL